jgi:hypothetical protein
MDGFFRDKRSSLLVSRVIDESKMFHDFFYQLTVHGDRIQLDVINPKREKSGVYKVSISFLKR